jgi:hypothetical protein
MTVYSVLGCWIVGGASGGGVWSVRLSYLYSVGLRLLVIRYLFSGLFFHLYLQGCYFLGAGTTWCQVV